MKIKKKILITGGNGYIGSCLAQTLYKKYVIFIIDKEKKNKFLSKRINYFNFDLLNKVKLLNTLKKIKPEVVIHLAGQSTIDLVDKKKKDYFINNFLVTKNIMECIKELQINNLVFSSTAAVYNLKKYKINEKSKIYSNNSYGKSKINCEKLIKGFNFKNFKYCILRFFNVASCIKKNKIGELHNPESHLIPIMINAIFKKKVLRVYGNNYATKDGTCMRDYVHISDIVRGIEKSINYLLKKNTKSEIFNLGSGTSYSVNEIIKCAFKHLNSKTKISFQKKRRHDPANLFCSISKAEKKLNWKPVYSNIRNIIKDEIWWYKYLKKINFYRKFIY